MAEAGEGRGSKDGTFAVPWYAPELLAIAALVRIAFVLSLGERIYNAGSLLLAPAVLALSHGRWPEGGLGSAPALPILLAIGHRLSGEHYRMTTRFVLVGLGLLTVLLSFLLARRVGGDRVARLALIAAALSPILLLASGSFSVPGTATCALVAAVLAGWEAATRATRGALVRFSLAMTLAWLSDRETLAPLAALMAWVSVCWWRSHAPRWRRLLGGTAAVLLLSLVVGRAVLREPLAGTHPARAEALLIARAIETDPDLVVPVEPIPVRRVAWWGRLASFAVPLASAEGDAHPLTRPGAATAAALYYLPLALLSTVGLLRGAARPRDRWLLAALLGSLLFDGMVHGEMLDHRVLAAPYLLVAAALGFARLRPVAERPSGSSAMPAVLGWRLVPRLRAASLYLGLGLLAITMAGLNVPLRNPEIYFEPADSRWSRIRLSEAQVHAAAASSRPDRREFLRLMNETVHAGLQHYWSPAGADRFALRVPFHENYLLNLASWVDPDRFRLYEFLDYRRALARGVGVCSQHAIVVTGLLQSRGVPARIVRLGGHVVVEAQADSAQDRWWVLDADFGVIVPHAIAALERDPGLAREAYRQAGYSGEDAAQISAYYGAAGNLAFPDAAHFAHPARQAAERASYVLLWIIPLLLVAPYGLASVAGSRETARM